MGNLKVIMKIIDEIEKEDWFKLYNNLGCPDYVHCRKKMLGAIMKQLKGQGDPVFIEQLLMYEYQI
jgi:Asp-tRNA(Asn)/Glu-tRNA(Gln) amidotransferase B subunit